jgi:hypothetical protein
MLDIREDATGIGSCANPFPVILDIQHLLLDRVYQNSVS